MIGYDKLESVGLKTKGEITGVALLAVVDDIAPKFINSCEKLAAMVV